MEKIIGYARVSTENQAYEAALRQQTERLLDAGASKVYADVASRGDDRRESVLEIMRLASEGEVSAVLITRLDRVTSSPGLFERLVQIFQQNNVKLIALDETIDVHSAEGEFVAGLQVQFAKRELNTIKLRVQKAYQHRRKKGKPNSQAPWGYRIEDGKYKLDRTPFLCLLSDRPKRKSEILGKTKADLARDIIDIFLEVRSLGKAVNFLHQKYGIYKFSQKERESKLLIFDSDREFEYNRPRQVRSGVFRWSRDGIKVYLNNPVLQGHTAYGVMTRSKTGTRKKAARSDWEIIKDTHPDERLITDEEFVRIQEIMEANKRLSGFGNTDRRQLLTGLLYCAECGRVLKAQGINYKGKEKRRTLYYQCKNWMERACSSRKMIEEDKAVSAIDAALSQRAESLAILALEVEDIPDPPGLKELKSQLAQLKMIPGNNPAIELAIGNLQSQIANLAIEHQRNLSVDKIDRESLVKIFSDPLLWLTLPRSQKQLIYERFVRQVLISSGEAIDVELKV